MTSCGIPMGEIRLTCGCFTVYFDPHRVDLVVHPRYPVLDFRSLVMDLQCNVNGLTIVWRDLRRLFTH